MQMTITVNGKNFVIDTEDFQNMENLTKEEFEKRSDLSQEDPNSIDSSHVIVGSGKGLNLFPGIVELTGVYLISPESIRKILLSYYELGADDTLEPEKLFLADTQWVLVFKYDRVSNVYLPKWIYNKEAIFVD